MHPVEQQWKTSEFVAVKADASIVRIETDEGVVGLAEPCAYGVPTLIAAHVERLRPELVGRDPLEAFALGLHPNGVNLSHDCAVAGIDAALWDIRGRVEGKRVADLLAPSGARDSVRLYASGGCNYDWRRNPETLIEEILEYQKRGYGAAKVRIGTRWQWDAVTPKRLIELFRELRHAVGDDFELMVDGNCRLNEDEALEVGRGLDQLHFAWFEEPISRDDMDGYVRLNAALDLPVTGGELFATLEQFYPYLESGAYAIAQPDIGICGMTEGWRIVEAATRFGRRVCPHNWHNGLLTMVQANFVAALPDPYVLELCQLQGPLQWEMLDQAPDISDGQLKLSATAGYGVALAGGIEERYPYTEGSWRLVINREDVLVRGPNRLS